MHTLKGMFEVICPEAQSKRERKVNDIVKRLGVITPDKVHLKNYPIDNPVTIFNPAFIIENGDDIKLYARIVLGYFTYTSAVAELEIPISDIYSLKIMSHYSADIVVYPSMKFDMWGVEDPRVYEINGKICMTYCGRTISYFNPAVRIERTLPVTAVRENGWRKICVFRLPSGIRKHVVSDKDSFLVKEKEGYLLFHRPHLTNTYEKYHLTVSKVPKFSWNKSFREFTLGDTKVVFEPTKFEERMGWGPAPIKVGKEHLFLIHAVDKEQVSYMIFAALLDLNKGVQVKAITPHYIMRPRMPYEVYGDRPHTIFPCGAQKVDNKIIISYGAADSAVAFGEINLDNLMSILDKNRLD